MRAVQTTTEPDGRAGSRSFMADNCAEGEVIGVAMDGLGFGTDGRLWGGEFFVADFHDAERIAHLEYIPMPGGARAIREPWRMAAGYLHRVFGDEFLNLDLPFVQNMDRKAWATLRRMIATGTNSPETSSMGRLFDAVSSLLGLRNTVNYEGQAAIELEATADRSCTQGYEFEIGAGGTTINAEPVIRRAVEDLLDGLPAETVSAKFHLGVIHLIVLVARNVRERRRLNRVALSGRRTRISRWSGSRSASRRPRLRGINGRPHEAERLRSGHLHRRRGEA